MAKKIYKIGIIGRGFVGSAVEHGFLCDDNHKADIKIFDKSPKLSTHSLEETVNHSTFIFVSVPTPANLNGSVNLDALDIVLNNINKCIDNDCIILIRSTITPGTSKFFSKKYPQLNIVFNPEFLTEKNAKEDFINQSRIILGGVNSLTAKVAELYKWRFDNKVPIIQTDYQTAELIKYMNNIFLATKVSFMNEMLLVANKVGANWEKAVEGFVLDDRVGSSHINVPGHDGKFGFGGSCFPKDIQAFIEFSDKLDVDLKVVKAAWDTNLKVRPERDWESLKGRAVVDKKID
tara:strand:- start:3163 stop:4035 length:873 start_codon:yes stop_codon:yes gene_type:complete